MTILSRHTAVVTDEEGGNWQDKARQGLLRWLEFWGLLDQDHRSERAILRGLQEVERQSRDSLTYRQQVLMALERYFLFNVPRRKFQDDFKPFREFFYPNAEKLEETHCQYWCAFVAGYYGITKKNEIILQREVVAGQLDRAAQVMEVFPDLELDLPDVRVFVMQAALHRFPVKAQVAAAVAK